MFNPEKLQTQIEKLAWRIENFDFPLNYSKNWSSKYILLINEKKHSIIDNKYVKTINSSYIQEISWLFNELEGIFKSNIDENERFSLEFFGRLANRINQTLRFDKNILINYFLLIIVVEVSKIIDEIDDDTFIISNTGMGNIIIDDIKTSLYNEPVFKPGKIKKVKRKN